MKNKAPNEQHIKILTATSSVQDIADAISQCSDITYDADSDIFNIDGHLIAGTSWTWGHNKNVEAISDACLIDPTNAAGIYNRPYNVNNVLTTQNNPGCVSGVRYVDVLDVRPGSTSFIIRIYGVDNTNTCHTWMRYYHNGTWTDWSKS